MKKSNFILLCGVLLAGCSTSDNSFDATGTFEATEIVVSSQAAGPILAFNIVEGDSVTDGQKLGLIDSTELFLTKMQLLKNIKSVYSNRPNVATQIAAIKEQIVKQKIEKERVEKLLKANAATSKQLDDINSAIAVLNRQLSAQESTLENNVSSIDAQSSAIEIQVAQIDYKLSKCVITSPIAGVVLAKYAWQGELASVGKPLFKVADLNDMYVRAYVTSGQLVDVKLGQKVAVMADFGGDKERHYDGVITWISSKSEFTPKNIQTKDERQSEVYAIKVAVENDGYIKIGINAQINF